MALVLQAAVPTTARADAILGNLFFTTFSGGQNIWKVDVTYDGATTFTLGSQTNVASTPGADGIVFDPVSGHLLIGGQGSQVHKVNPTTGTFTSVNAGATAFHLSVDPDGETVWAASIPGDLGEVPLNPFGPGIFHNVTGPDDNTVDTLAWVPKAGGGYTTWYTNSGSGGNGCIGTIDMSTFVTSRKLCLEASHGMAYDPFTGHLILMGGDQIAQYDPIAETLVGSLMFPGKNFDQGAVDGKGHIFAASNTGTLTFIDYAASHDIDTFTFSSSPFLRASLDDIAPLVGPGSQQPVPEPGTMALVGLGLGALVVRARRRARRN